MQKKNLLLTVVSWLVAFHLPAQVDYAVHSVFCTGLNVPNQIVFDTSGNLFVANHSYASYSGPYHNTIAKIDPAGNKSVFVSGYTWPSGLEIDLQQNLYFTQNNASSVIRKVTPAGTVSTFASLPHQPGPITLFDNNTNPAFAIYTVSHWGVKGIQKTNFSGSASQFSAGSFYACQLSNDGQYLFASTSATNQLMRISTVTSVAEVWVSQIQGYELWAGTIGPDSKLYLIGQSNCTSGKKAVFRINGQNSVTEFITNLPGTHEFNDLAFKQNGASWDLYLSEVAAGGRMDPASNRIIRFSDVFESGAIQITVDPCNNSLCAGDTATFTAFGLGALPAGSLQWYVNGVPVSGGDLNNGLVGFWPFDGNANDYSGNGNHAIQVTTTPTTDRHGNPNGAYNFAGLSNPQIIKVPNSPSLQFTNQATFSLWVHMNSYYGMNGWGQAQNYGVHMLFSKDFDQCCLYEAIGGLSTGNFTNGMCTNGWSSGINIWDTVPGSSIGEWFNLTTVFTPTEARMFVNGQIFKTLSGTTTFTSANSRDLYFGRLNSFWYPLNGKLDDVRFYNRALNDAEVSALYYGFDTTFSYIPQNGDTVYCVYTSAGSPTVTDTSNFIIMQVNALPADIGESTGMASLQNGLVAWYPFNGNANDESGNGFHGVNNGAQNTFDRCNSSNRAYSFDGIGSQIKIDSAFFNNGWDHYAISLWFNSSDLNKMMQCIFNTKPHNGLDLMFNYTNDKKFSYFVNTNPAVTSWDLFLNERASIIFQQDQWYHVVFQKNGNEYAVWINNILNHVTNGAMAPVSYHCSLYLGSISLNSEFFKGKIDDIRIYNRNLTLMEINELYNCACPITVELSSNTICNSGIVNVFLNHSQPGIQYQLLKSGTNFGPPQTGNGDTLTFPITGLTATSGFTIHALNPATGCNRMLDTTLVVTVVPFVPATSSNTSVCSGSNVVLQAFGGTNYLWSNGMTGSQITVAPLATTTYYVTVTNAEGCSGSDSVLVTVLPGPTPTLSGPGTICLGTNNAVYTTETGKSNYTWTVTGGTITAGAGTPSVTVTWNTLGAQSIGVNYANAQGCMAATATSLAVTVNPMAAPVITGSSNMCVNSGYYYYSTQPGMNNYQWSVSPGATIIWGQGTPDLIVTWDLPGAQWVAVNYTNSSGCTALSPTQFNITVNSLPGAAATITGPASVCAGATNVLYTTPLIDHADTYVWSLPPGASISSGAGTNAIAVDFSTTAQPGAITVYGNNLCGNGSVSSPLTISVGALPGLAGTPVGEAQVCEGDTGIIYYIPPIFNAASYVWEIQGGGVITAGNGTNSIRASFPIAPANCHITVFGANNCGQGQISPVKEVTVHPTPETPTITQNGDMLVSSAPDGNQWFLNSAIIPNATQQTYAPIITGQYSVQMTLEGCPSERSDEFYYIMTGIGAMSQLQVSVYPVPNDGLFRVTCTGMKNEPTRIAIVNALGVVIEQREALPLSGEYQTEFDLRPVVPGVYTMVIENSSYRFARKLMIQ